MYMLWFNFICFKLIIMHYHSQKLKEMQNFLNPRIKPNHNNYSVFVVIISR